MMGPRNPQPEFSRRLAMIVHTEYFHEKGLEFKYTFVDKVGKYSTFDELPDDLKTIIFDAEKTNRTN